MLSNGYDVLYSVCVCACPLVFEERLYLRASDAGVVACSLGQNYLLDVVHLGFLDGHPSFLYCLCQGVPSYGPAVRVELLLGLLL